MRDLLIRMAPEQFSDLVALVALYRPGPLDSGMVDTYVDTKHGRKKPYYPLPQLEEVLRETYGVIVYQEQVMKIANILAGYSLGDADILRRAMGKKIPEVMEEERTKFMAGRSNGTCPRTRPSISLISWPSSQVMALTNPTLPIRPDRIPDRLAQGPFPASVHGSPALVRPGQHRQGGKVYQRLQGAGIEVLPPDINESDKDFTVVNDRIRFGLGQ